MMADYGFVHAGKVFTPDRSEVAPEANADRNRETEAAELARWQGQPDRQLGYYDTGEPSVQLTATRYSGARSGFGGKVTTWLGTELGTITSWRVYRHNFGGRMIALRVQGTNGAEYHGRASYDWGSCVWLRRVKGKG